MSTTSDTAAGSSQVPPSGDSTGPRLSKKRRRKQRRGSRASGNKRPRGATPACDGVKSDAGDMDGTAGDGGVSAQASGTASAGGAQSGTSAAVAAAPGDGQAARAGYVVGRKSKKAVKRMRAGTMETAATPAALQAYRRKFGCPVSLPRRLVLTMWAAMCLTSEWRVYPEAASSGRCHSTVCDDQASV